MRAKTIVTMRLLFIMNRMVGFYLSVACTMIWRKRLNLVDIERTSRKVYNDLEIQNDLYSLGLLWSRKQIVPKSKLCHAESNGSISIFAVWTGVVVWIKFSNAVNIGRPTRTFYTVCITDWLYDWLPSSFFTDVDFCPHNNSAKFP